MGMENKESIILVQILKTFFMGSETTIWQLVSGLICSGDESIIQVDKSRDSKSFVFQVKVYRFWDRVQTGGGTFHWSLAVTSIHERKWEFWRIHISVWSLVTANNQQKQIEWNLTKDTQNSSPNTNPYDVYDIVDSIGKFPLQIRLQERPQRLPFLSHETIMIGTVSYSVLFLFCVYIWSKVWSWTAKLRNRLFRELRKKSADKIEQPTEYITIEYLVETQMTNRKNPDINVQTHGHINRIQNRPEESFASRPQ